MASILKVDQLQSDTGTVNFASNVSFTGTQTITIPGNLNLTGGGIKFPATQVTISDGNTLDDYEEGTWIPTDASGAGLVFVASGARYVKIGRLVQFWFRAQYPSTSNATNAAIGGLPYVGQAGGASSLDICGGWNTFLSQNFNNSLCGYVANGSTTMGVYSLATAQANPLTNANISTYNIYGYGSYYTAA